MDAPEPQNGPTHRRASDGTLTFNANGTLSTSKVDSKAEVTAPGTSTRATGR